VEANGVIELTHGRRMDGTDPMGEPTDVYRADLLSLSLGLFVEATVAGGEEDLEWMDPGGVRRDRHDGDNVTWKPPDHAMT
jgi:hypothetical protein